MKYKYLFLLPFFLQSCVTNEIDSKQMLSIKIQQTDSLMKNHLVSIYDRSGELIRSKYIEEVKSDTTVDFLVYPDQYRYSVVTNTDSVVIKAENYFNTSEIEKRAWSKFEPYYRVVEPIFYTSDTTRVNWEGERHITVEPQIQTSLLEVHILNSNIEHMPMFIGNVGTALFQSDFVKGDSDFVAVNATKFQMTRESSQPVLIYKHWIMPSVEGKNIHLKFFVDNGFQEMERDYPLNTTIQKGQHLLVKIDDLTHTIVGITVKDWGDIEWGGEVEPVQ